MKTLYELLTNTGSVRNVFGTEKEAKWYNEKYLNGEGIIVKTEVKRRKA